MCISSTQTRAARAMMEWTQDQLADAAGVNIRTITDFESGKRIPHRGTLVLLRQAFEAAGIEFIPEDTGGEGVRFRRPKAAPTHCIP